MQSIEIKHQLANHLSRFKFLVESHNKLELFDIEVI